MKKRLLASAAAAAVMLSAGVVFANPVDFSGNVNIENRQDEVNSVKNAGTKYTFRLNAKTNIGENVDFYTRFAAQGLSNSVTRIGNDFNTAGTSGNFVGDIDEFGFIYKNAGFTYKIGRQDLFLASGILADYTANVGKHYLLDGVTVSGKSGVTSLNFVALQEDNIGGIDNKIYAINASYAPAKDWTLGGTVARYAAPGLSTNYWAVDTSYTVGKATFAADYASSNASADNTAYSAGVTYAIDGDNTVSATNFKVGLNASINQWTTWWAGEKGYWYSYNHKLSKDTSVTFAYKDNRVLSNNIAKTSFRSTVNYKF